MTAYRSAPAPDQGPYVNEYLERALLELYGRHRRRDARLALGSLIALTLAVLYVLIAKPEDGWLCTPTAILGLPGAFGLLFFGWTYVSRRPHLLDHVRTGIAIQRVRRVERPVYVRSGLLVRVLSGDSRIHVSDIPTLCVDFSDGRATTLSGDVKQLARIEELLRIQMKKANPRLTS